MLISRAVSYCTRTGIVEFQANFLLLERFRDFLIQCGLHSRFSSPETIHERAETCRDKNRYPLMDESLFYAYVL